MNDHTDRELSKTQLLEVTRIVSDSTKGIKDEIDHKMDEFKVDAYKKWDNVVEFKTNVYRHFEKIEKSILQIEFKHNWKSAFWVFIGSATPVAIGIAVFLLTGKH